MTCNSFPAFTSLYSLRLIVEENEEGQTERQRKATIQYYNVQSEKA